MRVLDVAKHHIALVQTVLAKTALHELQVAKFVRVARLRFCEHALVEHLLVNAEELLLAPVDIDQS